MPRLTRVAAAAALTVPAIGLAAGAASPAVPARSQAAAAGSTCTTSFVASVRHGAHKGTDYKGVLTLKLDRSGRLTGGTFASLGGRRAAVTGHSSRRAISFKVPTADGVLRGTGTVSGSLRHCVGRLRGRLRGPAASSRGGWLATTGQTVQLPDGSVVFTGGETGGGTSPQVVYKAPALGPAAVFAGALNTPGNIDGARLSARMNRPSGLGYDAARNAVYVADVGNASIRRLDLGSNQVTTTLRASDFVTAARALGYTSVTGWEPRGIVPVAGGGGALLITDVRNYVVWRYNPTTPQLKLYAGQPGLSGRSDGSDTAVRFSAPQQITTSSDGLVAVAEPTANRVRLRDPGNGRWSTVGVCC